MRTLLFSSLALAGSLCPLAAATVHWSARVDNGLSLADGTALPAGSLVRVGFFRDASTGAPLSDAEILAASGSATTLDAAFVEVGRTTVGSGFSPALAGHFAASSTADTGPAGLNVAGRQICVWVLNAATAAAATQQAILYFDCTSTDNPDGTPEAPAARWVFPVQEPVPLATTIDLSDLTTGAGTLAAAAHVVVGTFPTGTSASTGASNLGLAALGSGGTTGTGGSGGTGSGGTGTGGSGSTSTTVTTTLASTTFTRGSSLNQTLTASGGTGPYTWSLAGGSLPEGVALSAEGVLSGTSTRAGVYTFTVQAQDSAGNTARREYTVTIGYVPQAAVLAGLVNDSTAQVGSGTVRLATTAKGLLTGRVVFENKAYVLRGPLSSLGQYTQSFSGGPSITVDLSAGALEGTLTLGGQAYALSGGAAVTGTTRAPVAGAGYYTMLLQSESESAAGATSGYLGVTVSPLGAVTWVGQTADRQALSGGTVWLGDRFPLSNRLYLRSSGYLQGTPVLKDEAFFATATWYKPAGLTGALYSSGLPLVPVSLAGRRYTAPATGARLLAGLESSGGSLRITLAGGELPATVERTAVVSTRHVVSGITVDALKLRLVFVPARGLFGGYFVHPADGRVRAFNGAVVQGAAGGDGGEGSFLGTSTAGSVVIEPASTE